MDNIIAYDAVRCYTCTFITYHLFFKKLCSHVLNGNCPGRKNFANLLSTI